jgi:hypothetical protein
MTSSWILRCVDLERTDVSEEHIAFIVRVTRIGEPATTLAITSNRSTRQRTTMWERKLHCFHHFLQTSAKTALHSYNHQMYLSQKMQDLRLSQLWPWRLLSSGRERVVVRGEWTDISGYDEYSLLDAVLVVLEPSVLTRSTQLHIPEKGILHSHHCGNIKYYMPEHGHTVMLSKISGTIWKPG